MSFVYCLCAYDQTPLAEHDEGAGGNYKQVARDLLGRMKFDGSRAAFDADQFIFSCLSETNKLAVIVLSNRGVNANARFYAVDQVRTRFVTKYLSSMSKAAALSKSAEFAPEIQRIFRECQSPSSAKIAQINANLEKAQAVMTENLQTALKRSERLEVMEAKSQEIKASASAFEKEATKLKSAMCFQRYKWYVIIGIIVLVVIAVIIVIVVVATGGGESPAATPTPTPAPAGALALERGVSG
jgi:uncharacterized integral membrane protein